MWFIRWIYKLFVDYIRYNKFKSCLYSTNKFINILSYSSWYWFKTKALYDEQWLIYGFIIMMEYFNNIKYAECKWYSDKTFKELFFKAVLKDDLKIDELNKNICHSFLLKHQENRIVKKYNTPGLVLVHCIDMETHKLISNEDIKELYKKEGVHINVAKKYDFKDIESISNHMNDLTFESQGLVIKYIITEQN